MKIFRMFLIVTIAVLFSFAAAEIKASDQSTPAIIPLPVDLQMGEGQFQLNPASTICADSCFLKEAEYLARQLRTATGYQLEIKVIPPAGPDRSNGNTILLASDPSLQLGDEGYSLTATPGQVVIRAGAAAGAFYGIQTLLQLFPPAILSKTRVTDTGWVVPEVRIKDSPRFGWRAYLLDEARWFKGAETVKSLLDQMALHKMNVFQWHLTDDQGWRIEIKRYPKLTEIGSRRKDTQIGGWDSKERTGKPHAGFYTQEQIREIVQYAADRHITIVPEIEMPGHASAAIAAYPEIGTSGRVIEVAVTFGKKYDTFNVADERVYTFLENILQEVMDLFPSRVIHLGGDEVRFDHWLASSQVKELMQSKNLSGPAQVQLYFTNRMSQFLEREGHRMMGWNEILGDDLHGFIKSSGGKEVTAESDGRELAQNAIVHFWKGSLELAERAAREGHDIVNSLHSSTYLDYTYDDIPLEKAYAFEPIPPGLAEQYQPHVIGMGCQMWGEWIPTRERLEYQTFPRFSAYAEVSWTVRERKDFKDFMQRLKTQQIRWDIQGIGYGPAGP
ncbi:MAG TPA: beta-N-acetylhexosaminidase [archaeon]|nr:beta-N-acetylhexosaminidase [archaeon]